MTRTRQLVKIYDRKVSMLLPTTALAIVVAVARLAHRSWVSPGPFVALFWLMMSLLTVLGVVCMDPGYVDHHLSGSLYEREYGLGVKSISK